MSNWKKYIPEGTNDVLFEDCTFMIDIQNILRNTYINSGFMEVKTPTIEFYDVFSAENQPIAQEKMYKLFDNQGRILVLRPDVTTPIARITATKLKNSTKPLRLCYNSNIFRINENLNGKKSEINQSGVEILGVNSARSDAEVIITAINALLAAGLKDFKIEIGHTDFFKGLVEELSLDSEEIEKLRRYIEIKNFNALKEFLEDNKQKISESLIEVLNRLPQFFGGIEIVDTARKLTDNGTSVKALDNIVEVYEILEKIGLSDYITVDLGMVHHINYYTGIIFRGYSSEIGDDILRGGRYDNLVQQFGTSTPATGFAINVDSIMAALKNQNYSLVERNNRFLIYYNDEQLTEAYKLASIIRSKGYTAEMSLYKTEKDALDYGCKKNFYRMLAVDENKNVQVMDFTGKCFCKMRIKDFIEGGRL